MVAPLEEPCVIVVEGKTDQHVVLHLLGGSDPRFADYKVDEQERSLILRRSESVDGEIAICEEGSVQELCGSIEWRLKASGLRRIGFVFDANDNPNARWERVRNEILKVLPDLKRVIPAKPTSEGVWNSKNGLAVGMWMMPDNKSKGAVEDFLVRMIPDGDYCWGQARNYVGEVGKKRKTLRPRKIFASKDARKAEIHAWLAVQENPGSPPGLGIGAGYFKSNIAEVQLFQDWLVKLQAVSA